MKVRSEYEKVKVKVFTWNICVILTNSFRLTVNVLGLHAYESESESKIKSKVESESPTYPGGALSFLFLAFLLGESDAIL